FRREWWNLRASWRMLSLSMRCACRMRAYSSTLTILHLLWPGSPRGEPVGEPAYRRSLRVGPFSTRILAGGGPGLDEEYQAGATERQPGPATGFSLWRFYGWQIESYHKVLKSGCQAEHARLRTAERLTNLLAVLCVVGWRVFWLTMVNRANPDAPPE